MFGFLSDSIINGVKTLWGTLNNYGIYDDVVYSAARFIPKDVLLDTENNLRKEIYFGLVKLSEGDDDLTTQTFIDNLKIKYTDELQSEIIVALEQFAQKHFLETGDQFFIPQISGHEYKNLINKLEDYFVDSGCSPHNGAARVSERDGCSAALSQEKQIPDTYLAARSGMIFLESTTRAPSLLNPFEFISKTANYIYNHPTEIFLQGLALSASVFQANKIISTSSFGSSSLSGVTSVALTFTTLSQQFLITEAAFPAVYDLNNLNNTSTNVGVGVIFQGRRKNDCLGITASTAGDVNNDGFADVLIGAYGANSLNRGNYTGETYLLFGRGGNWETTFDLNNLNGTNGVIFQGRMGGDEVGISVTSAGDVNNDGFADIFIGADGANSLAGETYLIFGHGGSWEPTFDLRTINGTNGVIFQGIKSLDYSGYQASAAGDVNKDGFGDVLIGAYNANPLNRNAAGETYLLFGHNGSWVPIFDLNTTNGTNGVVFQGRSGNDYSGISVSTAGDVNNDGCADILIGAYGSNSLAGETYLIFGHEGSWTSIVDLNTLNGTNGVIFLGRKHEDYSGVAVSAAGDVNNDGYEDVLIGATGGEQYLARSVNTGETYLVFGHGGSWPGMFDLNALNGTNGVIFLGRKGGDLLGYSVSTAGDVNKDGYKDMLLGASGANPLARGNNTGEAYLVFGHGGSWVDIFDLNAINDTQGVVFQGRITEGQAGHVVSMAGDVNNDGFADFLITAWLVSQSTQPYLGETYLIFGWNTTLPITSQSSPSPVSLSASPTLNSPPPPLISSSSPILQTPASPLVTPSPLISLGAPSSGLFSSSPVISEDGNSSSTNPNNLGLILGLLFAGLCLIGTSAAGVFLLWRFKPWNKLNAKSPGSIKQQEIELNHSSVVPSVISNTAHSSINIESSYILSANRKEGRTNIGNKYDLIRKINREEAELLKIQMGIDIKFPSGKNTVKPLIGEGRFGKLRIAQDIESKQFVGVKKIKGTAEITASENEGNLQKKLNGLRNIMPLLDSVKSIGSGGQPALYQFMPLAGFGNGETLAQVLAYSKQSDLPADEQKRRKVIIHVAKNLLYGFKNMHEKHIYHLDFKPSNFVIDNKGDVYIIDFGCAVESQSGSINFEKTGDIRYFSPERYDAIRQQKAFDGAKNDAWALGLALLEIITGNYPFDARSNDEKFANWNEIYFKNKLSQIPELQNPKPESIWAVIAGLLETDPNKRLNINQAIQKRAFKDDNYGHFDTATEQKSDFEYMKTLLDNPAFNFTVKDSADEKADYPLIDATHRQLQPSPYPLENDNTNDNSASAQQRDVISSKALQTSGTFAKTSRAAANESEINRYSHTQTDLQQKTVMNMQQH